MKMSDSLFWLVVAVLFILLIAGLGVGIIRGVDSDARYDAICKRAGYDEREILSNRRAYCVDYWTEYRIIPFEMVLAGEGDSR